MKSLGDFTQTGKILGQTNKLCMGFKDKNSNEKNFR